MTDRIYANGIYWSTLFLSAEGSFAPSPGEMDAEPILSFPADRDPV